ncbi:hypothetical protein HK096_010182, partial [Nowakowskiella sp. JEL0078]
MGKHKRRSKESESDSDSNSSSSESSVESRKKHKSRDKKKIESKKRKRETSSERKERKRLQKLDKKQLKKEIKEQQDSQVAMHLAVNLGYSNTENPFGDSNLNSKFVWIKKRELDAKAGVTTEERIKRDMTRRHEIKSELESLNNRRTQRDIDAELRASESERLQRERDLAALGDWESREDTFHLEQSHSRAQIRISAGRAKPIDILAMNIALASDTPTAMKFESLGLEFDLDEPYLLFNRLKLDEVKELFNEIRMYLALEKEEKNKKFWEAMIVVCEDELSKLRDAKRGSEIDRAGVHLAVALEVDKLLSHKTSAQLDLMMKQVRDKLSGPNPGDVEYWESLVKGIVVWKAKAALRDMHAFMIKKRIERLKKIADESGELPTVRGKVSESMGSAMIETIEVNNKEEPEAEAEDEEEMEPYDPSMSPVPIANITREDKNFEVIDEEADLDRILTQRRIILNRFGAERRQQIEAFSNMEEEPYLYTEADDELYRLEAEKAVDSDEEIMGEETTLTSVIGATNKPSERNITIPNRGPRPSNYMDKYRPRKPRYLNRVQTGYEWNKYNQTHYDTDNPPPKVVQGYKFNIFYPDLIDRSVTPTYKRIKDPESEDIETLLFTAGPPYEDVAFKIVKREWELSHKKGFRNSFDRGVLQLHFHFKTTDWVIVFNTRLPLVKPAAAMEEESFSVKECREASIECWKTLISRIEESGLNYKVKSLNPSQFGIFIHCPENVLLKEAYKERVLDWVHQIGNSPLNPPEPPVELPTTAESEKAKNLTHITPSERLRYIHNLLTSPHYEGGVGLTSDSLVAETSGAVGGKFIEAIFPPHDQDFNKKWINEWSHKWLLSTSDINEIRDHFGEKLLNAIAQVAFYFAFLQYYFLALGIPAVAGLLTFFFAPLYSVYYAAFMIIWSAVFLAFWQYTAYGWAVRWGVKDYFKTERIRPEFRPEKIREDALTGERVPYYPVWKRWVNFGSITIPSILGVILFLATLIISFLSLEIFITEYYNGPYKSILSLIPTVLYSVILPFVTGYYQKLALKLNILENHPTDSSYDYAFTQKIFIFFSLVNWLALSVLGVFIVPFNDIIGDILERNGLGSVSLSSKSTSLGPKTLVDRVFYFVATAQIVNAFTETFLPMLMKKATKVIDEKIYKKTEKDLSGDPDAVFVKRIIEELALPEYDVYGDYAEMTTQFGFAVLFSVAWPLAPVTSFINNFFELRGDA